MKSWLVSTKSSDDAAIASLKERAQRAETLEREKEAELERNRY